MATDSLSAGVSTGALMTSFTISKGPSTHVEEETPVQIASESRKLRVCDKCMIKKRKCNRQLPTCSRCLDDNIKCVYTSTKRKPGPAKGSQRRKAKNTGPGPNVSITNGTFLPLTNCSPGVEQGSHQYTPEHGSEGTFFIPEGLNGQLPEGILSQHLHQKPYNTSGISTCTSSSVSQGFDHLNSIDPQIPPDQILQILESFFISVHPSFYLFDRRDFMRSYELGEIDGNLLVTILAISSHVLGLSSLWTTPSLSTVLKQLLMDENSEIDTIGELISLSRFQQTFLIAFYEFHQYPGRKSWLRVSKLTREAYELGLHQIDHPDQCQLYDNSPMDTAEREEWRRLWWCIYCLDSYCNITALTPFIIELDGVKTALISNDVTRQHHPDVFLPPDTDRLWETCQSVSSRPGNYYINVHIVTTTLLRKAGKLLRLGAQNPTPQTEESLTILDEHLSAVRLALPPRFFDISRNVVDNESQAEHHARLICNLHMHITRLLVTTPRSFEGGEVCWRKGWTSVLECCEDVVMIVRQWKAQLCPSVDPAICFIISSVLMILHLHSVDISNAESFEFLARLRGQKELLRLFLEQFASLWHLPRFLLVSYGKFTEIFSRPLTATEIAGVASKMGGSLNKSWMRQLSLTSSHLRPPDDIEFDASLFSAADFRDWEFWADISSMTCMP